MVVALRQAGNSDGAHASGAGKINRETAAVRSVVLQFESDSTLQGGLSFLVLKPNCIRAAVITHDYILFAANPVEIVGCGSGHGVRK